MAPTDRGDPGALAPHDDDQAGRRGSSGRNGCDTPPWPAPTRRAGGTTILTDESAAGGSTERHIAASEPPQEPTRALRAVTGRRSVSKLTEPGPTPDELGELLAAACTAPDHGKLRPWRFLVLEGDALRRLGDAYARALSAREPTATAEDLDRARGKPQRSPVLVAVVARLTPHATVREWEQLVAAGCAAHNLCIAATAHGYGSMWRTGWYAEHPEVLAHLGLDANERLVGLVHLGSIEEGFTPPPRTVDTSCVSWSR